MENDVVNNATACADEALEFDLLDITSGLNNEIRVTKTFFIIFALS